MKNLLILLFTLFSLNALAQIKGNKQIVTKTYPIENLTSIEMNLYAIVEVYCSGKEEMTITADENLLELIEKSVENGQLKLTQKEWIQPSTKIKITIGAPNLERIQNSVHETIRVINIDRSEFNAMAILGKLVLKGKVETLAASGELGEVDATGLAAETVNVNQWGRGKIQLAAPELISGIVKDDGQIIYSSNETRVEVKKQDGGIVRNELEPFENNKFDTRFIEFKVKNNSANRIQCYVKGPKPDGTYFSYGFPMNPGQTRKKNWTIGSKVFRVTPLGTKKMLTEIKGTDENEVVKLYNAN